MSFVDWKSDKEAEEYLKNIAAEYSFSCYKEKDPEGCRLLGEYEYNVKVNFEKAAKIYEHACDTYSEPESCNRLAYMKGLGKGVPRDLPGAAKLAQKACDIKARTCLTAAMFASSDKNWPLAAKCLERACQEGNQGGACTRLADIKLKGRDGPVESPKTGQLVLQLLDRACELGDAPGCVNASALLFGKAEKLASAAGIEQNQRKAAQYRDRAKQLTIPARGGPSTT